MENKSCAIRIEGCEGVTMTDNKFSGFDNVVDAKNSRNIKFENNIITKDDQDIIIENVMKEMNKRFYELKKEKDKSSKKVDILKDTLSKISAEVISNVITNMIK